MKIGICGGTFDPFHRGHLEPVLAVRDALGWDRIVYVPASVQPFKQERGSASGFHRFAMAALATADLDGVWVSPRELERGGVSYTVDTLAEARAEFPDATIDWIVGDDNLAALPGWRSLGRIFELANFAVLTRDAAVAAAALPAELAGRRTEAAARGRSGAIVFAGNDVVPVSSTEIRRRAAAGEPIEDLAGPRVARYIQHYGLYRKGHS